VLEPRCPINRLIRHEARFSWQTPAASLAFSILVTYTLQYHCRKHWLNLLFGEPVHLCGRCSRMVQMQTTRLPRIPEAIIPGTPFGIEVLKSTFALFCLLSLVGSIPGLHSVRTEHSQFVANHNSFGRLLSLVNSILFAVGFYGIHRRLRLAWKVGWFYLGFFYLSSIVSAISAIPPTSNRWTASPLVAIAFTAVAVYWGNWWNKQKAFFNRGPNSPPRFPPSAQDSGHVASIS